MIFHMRSLQRKSQFFIWCFVILLAAACSRKKEMSIADFSSKNMKNAILVDVRTPDEFSTGHMEQAINVNWFEEDFGSRFDTLPRRTTIYLYCGKGVRSAKAASFLDSLGYRTVDLLGGYQALK